MTPWRAAAAATQLRPSVKGGAPGGGLLGWRGTVGGHDVDIACAIAAIDRVWVTVTVRSPAIGDHLSVVPTGLSLSRDGRFITGDPDLDRLVVIHGEHPEVAAPWDASTRALAARLIGGLGVVILGGTLEALPHVTAATASDEAATALVKDMLAFATRLASGRAVAEAIEAIAAADPAPTVRALYARLLADIAPTGVLGEARAEAAMDALADDEDAWDMLVRTAKTSPSAQARERAFVKLLSSYPLAAVEPLLLETEDTLGARVRDALIAAMHRTPRPASALPLLMLMARTPLGPTGLQAAAAALGAVGDPASLARLVALCQHPDEPVWTTAAVSLLELDLAATDIVQALERTGSDVVLDRLPDLILARRPARAREVLAVLAERCPAGLPRRAAYLAALATLNG